MKSHATRLLAPCKGWPRWARIATPGTLPLLGVGALSGGIKQPGKQPGSSAYYASYDAAMAAGVAPIYRGQPGYRSGLDRDGCGVACE